MRLKLKILIFISIWFLPFLTRGQVNSIRGFFQVDTVQGCPNLGVNILNTNLMAPAFKCPICEMYWGDGTTEQQDVLNHSYAQSGTFFLKLLYGSVISPNPYDSIKIIVTPDIQPAFEAYACDGAKISIKITDTNYDQYEVNYNGTKVTLPLGIRTDSHSLPAGQRPVSVKGLNVNAARNCTAMVQQVTSYNSIPILPKIDLLTVKNSKQIKLEFKHKDNVLYKLEIATNNSSSFQQYQNLYNIDSITISNLRTDQNYYCFRIGTFNPCTNSIKGYSDVICSAKFTATPQSDLINGDRITLNWTTSTTYPIPLVVTNFTIDEQTRGSIGTVSPPTSTLDDKNVVCKTTYNYVLTTAYSNGSKSIVSQPATAFSSKVPTTIDNVTSVVTQTGVNLEWLQDPLFTPSEYSIFRSDKPLSVLTTTPNPQFTDPEYNQSSNFCYAISYKDVCDNVSPTSIDVCPIQLSGTLQKDNSISLIWPPYDGWKNGVQGYSVDKFDSKGQLIKTFNVSTANSLLDNEEDLTNQVLIYVVRATANDPGLNQSISNTFTIIKEPNLYYPTAFTPGSPPLNDIFNVFCQFTSQFEMNIFNRWGELMYTTTDFKQGWDGNYKGNPMPEGTYAFTAHITDFAGRNFTRSGSVVLLRKK